MADASTASPRGGEDGGDGAFDARSVTALSMSGSKDSFSDCAPGLPSKDELLRMYLNVDEARDRLHAAQGELQAAREHHDAVTAQCEEDMARCTRGDLAARVLGLWRPLDELEGEHCIAVRWGDGTAKERAAAACLVREYGCRITKTREYTLCVHERRVRLGDNGITLVSVDGDTMSTCMEHFLQSTEYGLSDVNDFCDGWIVDAGTVMGDGEMDCMRFGTLQGPFWILHVPPRSHMPRVNSAE